RRRSCECARIVPALPARSRTPRGATRCRGAWRSAAEAHAWRRALRLVAELEVVAPADAEAPGDDVPGERLDRGVEIADDGVVVAPGVLDRVLEAGELALKLQEVLVRPQLWVALGDGEERTERARERGLGLRLVGGGRRLHGRAARPRHLFERRALVGRIALHGLDEVRDELVPALQLHVDVAPRRLGG